MNIQEEFHDDIQFEKIITGNIQNKMEVKTMGTMKEEAQAYESKQMKNISELSEVTIDPQIKQDTFDFEKDGKTKTVNRKFIEINNEKYRVPDSVFKQLKVHIEENPNFNKFKVKKTGVGLDTEYTVIPLG